MLWHKLLYSTALQGGMQGVFPSFRKHPLSITDLCVWGWCAPSTHSNGAFHMHALPLETPFKKILCTPLLSISLSHTHMHTATVVQNTHRSWLICWFSFECICFRRITFIYFHACVIPKSLVSLTSQLEACNAGLRCHRQTDKYHNHHCTCTDYNVATKVELWCVN